MQIRANVYRFRRCPKSVRLNSALICHRERGHTGVHALAPKFIKSLEHMVRHVIVNSVGLPRWAVKSQTPLYIAMAPLLPRLICISPPWRKTKLSSLQCNTNSTLPGTSLYRWAWPSLRRRRNASSSPLTADNLSI